VGDTKFNVFDISGTINYILIPKYNFQKLSGSWINFSTELHCHTKYISYLLLSLNTILKNHIQEICPILKKKHVICCRFSAMPI